MGRLKGRLPGVETAESVTGATRRTVLPPEGSETNSAMHQFRDADARQPGLIAAAS